MLFGMSMNMQPVANWGTFDIVTLIMMWAIMMAGMMLPSAYPIIMWVEKINQKRQTRQASYTPTFYFIAGYLLIWGLYSVGISIIQYALHHAALLNPMMTSAEQWFSATLLITAGLYQFTPLKQRCLQLCRSPLSLLSTQWREGIKGAIRLGFKHGQYCVGCCWFLMSLLFVTGVMNLKWIFVLTVVVLLEKIIFKNYWLDKGVGIGLITLGVAYCF